jgi:hypothetical protein
MYDVYQIISRFRLKTYIKYIYMRCSELLLMNPLYPVFFVSRSLKSMIPLVVAQERH